MPGHLFIILVLPIAICYSQETYPRPSFPDVFQTEIEGTFKEGDGVVEIDSSMFYDREKNRAALFMIKDNELTRQAYDFDNDESLNIDGNDCDVQEIPDQQGFFPFTIEKGKKKLSSAEEAFYFTKSELDRQSLSGDGIPTLIYHAKIDIPQYGKTNCAVTHVFSKPDFELATCKEGWYCNSTLLSLSVECKNEQGETDVDHVYRFSRFKGNIDDESVFLPPPGIHCEMKNTLPMPPFPSYFSFTYDIIENPTYTEGDSSIFKMHKEIWYDADYKIARLDEFDYDALYFSSRVFDLKADVSFAIVGSHPICDTEHITSDFKLDLTTRLPNVFFAKNYSSTAVFVGKRNVHGLDYQVWSLMWTDTESAIKVVEEVYFLQIDPNKDTSSDDATKKFYSQISHIDTYTYEMNDDSVKYKLNLLRHISINNYRTKPKEWSAFDVSSCFEKSQKKKFSIKIEKFPLVKGSQSYKEVLELFYDKIIAATGVSIVRISELRGYFDGLQLLEIRGSILDNSKSSNWPTYSKEPGMQETFKLIKKAAADGKLSVTFEQQNEKERKIKIISVDDVSDYPPEDYPRPSFPDVFQAEIEGTIKKEDAVVEIDSSIFYDREKNRVALIMLKDNELTRQAFNFDNDESITIKGNECDVQEISDQQVFFSFIIENGKKKLSSAEEAFFFTKSELDRQSLSGDGIPTLIYHAKIDIPQYGKTNCAVTHVFSKPDFELATCKEGWYCNSTLLSLSVQCKNGQGETDVDHVYRFSHFKGNIDDESVFLPPPGVHCEMKNTLPMPPFPSYFSLTYDIIVNPTYTVLPPSKTHKEVWYDADYKIVRIDKLDNDALFFSSEIFDVNAGVSFTIVGSLPTCFRRHFTSDFILDITTDLPTFYFPTNASTSAVFVGKRKVHGLDYQVWSLVRTNTGPTTRIVEEAYFLQIPIDPNRNMSSADAMKTSFSQLSHINTYTYEMNDDSGKYKLVLLKAISINNYQTKPKELSAFDVSSCFEKNQKKKFSIKIEKFPVVKGSQSYKEVLEHFYDKIIAATGVSVIRISELRGYFDGLQLLEIRGSILDNSKSSNLPTNSKEPGMEETFKLIQKAAADGKLSVTFKQQDEKEKKIKVISVDDLSDSPPGAQKSCFSGASMAAASLVLFLIGISFGIAGYYVFLKKRKLSNAAIRMTDLKP